MTWTGLKLTLTGAVLQFQLEPGAADTIYKKFKESISFFKQNKLW